jgi:oligopeptide/dipeptide ABC transporter ATP-binding protein
VTAEALLRLDSVDVDLGPRRRPVRILSGVDLEVRHGEIVGVIGETGSGKTTLARTIVGLITPASGEIRHDGDTVLGVTARQRRRARRTGRVQFVFQDPLRSLDPDLTVRELVAEGLRIRGGLSDAEVEERVAAALGKVGLDGGLLAQRPGQISGGQRQRVSIARALVMDPELLICDEPVSALDASNRNQVLALLDHLRTSLGIAIIVISHDLSSLAGIADRVVVLYQGRIVETGPISEVFQAPRHPYTALLVASAPSLGGHRRPAVSQLRAPSAGRAAAGACVFSGRCRFATEVCAVQPATTPVDETWTVACHHQHTWPAELASR